MFVAKQNSEGIRPMEQVSTKLGKKANQKTKYDRGMIANKMNEFDNIRSLYLSERQTLRALNVRRTTGRYWLSNRGKSGLSPIIEQFFESLEGQTFLHQLVIAAKFVMMQIGGCGIRLVSLFFKLSCLDRFVASSIGALHKQNILMEQAIVEYEQQEKVHLAKNMPKKNITTAQDETFHPQPCLVAIEPISNFIVAEKYSEKRDAKSWTQAMKEGLQGLPVKIIQTTSDEGAGLLKFVKEELGAHHSPDIPEFQANFAHYTPNLLVRSHLP